MKKFIDTGQSLLQRSGSNGNILVGAHGLGHLGSVSPTRIVAGHTSALRNLVNAGPAASGLALTP